MSRTPPELLAPYKAALVAAARDLLRAAGSDGIVIEIPASVPPAVIVLGAEDHLGKLLRAPAREPMLGGRRAGDVQPGALTWDEPGPGPRGWTLLLAADGTGVAGKQGSTFEPAAPQLERVDVVEAEPVLRELAELQRENAALRAQVACRFDFHAHLARQAAWSELTFGPGPRTKGVCDHIRKELLEIEADPTDLREWVDVVILGLDGAWRCGGTPEQIIDGIVVKQTKNEGRTWPDWRTADPDKAIEHDRSGEAVAQKGGAS